MSEQRLGNESKAHLLDKLYRLYLTELTKTKSDFAVRMASLARAVELGRTLERLRALGVTPEELAAARAQAEADAKGILNAPSPGGTKTSAAWSPAPYPGHGTQYGYSAQSWLAREVNQLLHPGTFFCWFAKTFNAMKNGDDSNPIWIYLILDRAVEQGGVNNAKVRDVRANLMRAADKELAASGRSSEIPAVLAAIASAPLASLTPQLWRIDLSKVSGRYTSGHQYPDEFSISDLKLSEFEIVVP